MFFVKDNANVKAKKSFASNILIRINKFHDYLLVFDYHDKCWFAYLGQQEELEKCI